MKPAYTFLTLGLCFLLAPAGASAQTQKPDDSAGKMLDLHVNLARQDWRDQKKQIVAANLPLTGDEAAKFWPLYTDYTQQTIAIYDQRYALVKEYAAGYKNMNDETAASFIRRWIAVDESAARLRLEWIPKFEQTLGEKKAAIFFQIDRRLGLIQDLQISSQLPLIQH